MIYHDQPLSLRFVSETVNRRSQNLVFAYTNVFPPSVAEKVTNGFHILDQKIKKAVSAGVQA